VKYGYRNVNNININQCLTLRNTFNNTKKRSFKKSTLTKAIFPLFTATLIAGCGSDNNSDNGTDTGSSGLYPAAENEVVIYYKRDVAAASTSGSTYDGWGLHLMEW